MPSPCPVSRLVLVAGLVALSVSACGRRGSLEPPPNPAAPAAQTQSEDETTLPSPIGTPQKAARTPYQKPKKPFILDPIL